MKPQSKPTIYLLNGDFRNLFKTLHSDFFDLILTDPPYTREGVSLWGDLAKESSRVLKPAGWFVPYLGHMFVHQTLPAMAQHLTYDWILSLVFNSGYQQRHTGIHTRSNLIGLYHKPPRAHTPPNLCDVLAGSPNKEKEFHPWQKPRDEVRRLIQQFSQPEAWILDPCAGSGTTLLAAFETGRNAVGFELDPGTHATATKRLEAAGIAVRR